MTLTTGLIIGFFLLVAGTILVSLARGTFTWKPALVVGVLALGAISLYWPGEYGPRDRLRLGLDLAGGTTMVYDVLVPPEADPDEVIPNLISVLRDRVDPRGVMNLSWRQIAGNRIEIQMPLAPPETRALRDQFMEAREALLAENISRQQLVNLVEADAERRSERIADLAGDDDDFREDLEALVEGRAAFVAASEPYHEATEALRDAERELRDLEARIEAAEDEAAQADPRDEQQQQDEQPEEQQAEQAEAESDREDAAAQDAGESEDAGEADDAQSPADDALAELEQERDRLEARIAELEEEVEARALAFLDARDRFNELQDRILTRNISPDELDRALELSTEPRVAGEPSPRAEALESLKQSHPDRAERIDRLAEVHTRYEQRRGPLDSHEDLITLLRGSGILEFRIAAMTPDLAQRSRHNVDANLSDDQLASYREQLEDQGPRAGQTRPWRWFPVDDVEQFAASPGEREMLEEDPEGYFIERRGLIGQRYGDEYYVLLANTEDLQLTRDMPDWELTEASPFFDTQGVGGRAISFRLNPVGGSMMGRLTGPNVGRPMAILLDNQVLSAPTLQSRIADRGQITGGAGGFTQQEQNYLVRTLQAGSAAAELAENPSMIQTTSPQLGEDYLRMGMQAAIYALIVVGLFILVYYFFAGMIADFALMANMVLILGVMAMFQATFTLPGIAGLVLTIGMAVDANVLIFERIREERVRGADLPTAVRLGFDKALSTIVDANLTTLITCVVLYYFATTEIRGFAVVLLVGILATLFTALFGTRTILEIYLKKSRSQNLPMMPTVFPAIHRLLSPNVDWVGKRFGYFTVSGLIIVIGLSLVFFGRGVDMLDIEFRAGTQVSFELAEGESLPIEEARERLTEHAMMADRIAHDAVEPAALDERERRIYEAVQPIVDQYGRAPPAADVDAAAVNGAAPPDERIDFSLLAGDRATVVSFGRAERGEAAGFNIATLITDTNAVGALIRAAFDDVLDVASSIAFADEDAEDVAEAPVFPVRERELGRNIGRPEMAPHDVSEYLGGVAIVLEQMNPAPTIDELEQRIRRMRMQPEFQQLGYRQFEIVGLSAAADAEGDQPRYTSAVLVSRDQHTDYTEAPEAFNLPDGLAQTEWNLARQALERDDALGSVTNFSPAVSRTMQQQAISALLLALLAVVGYIWFRFGSVHYGFAAIVALVHDVAITLSFLAVSAYLYETFIGSLLLLEPFRINTAIIAAMLTIVGYSLNDTIVVFDRIRENRGRLAVATPGIINDSINQTISRTVITSGSTLLAVGILYVFGGPGVHGFAFAVLVGVLVGTYSSIAIASPVLLLGKAHRRAAAREAEQKGRAQGDKGVAPAPAT